MSGLERCMFPRAAFAIVFLSDGDPTQAVGLVVTCDVRNRTPLASQLVLDLVHLVIFGIRSSTKNKHHKQTKDLTNQTANRSPNEQVIGNVVQMPPVLQPRPRGRNVIRRALALDFDQHYHVLEIFAVPLVERLQQLQALRLRIDGYLNGAAVGLGLLVGVLARVEALGRQLVAKRRRQFEFLAVLA